MSIKWIQLIEHTLGLKTFYITVQQITNNNNSKKGLNEVSKQQNNNPKSVIHAMHAGNSQQYENVYPDSCVRLVGTPFRIILLARKGFLCSLKK